jgi:hypothetical protein
MKFWTVFPLVLLVAGRALGANEQLVLRVVDRDNQKPLPCRMHLKNAQGRPVKIPDVPYWKDHFVFDGEITLKLPRGAYTFEIERGNEYLLRTGHFRIEPFANDRKTIDLKRYIDMAKQGWYAGDLHVHRPPDDIPLLMRAEDLYVAPVITWWNKTNVLARQKQLEKTRVQFDGQRYFDLLGGEDERQGGALLFFNLQKPLDLTAATQEYPSPMKFLEEAASGTGVHIDIEKPFWWDVPVWLASGRAHSIGLANNHMHRDGVMDGEAWGKPRNKTLFPGPWGNGRWSQAIYYHVLNAGLKIPPSAGSASGVLPNPVGYNRVYVFCGENFDYDRWFAGLRAGRVVVTNGPLIMPSVNGELPGHTFQVDAGKSIELEIGLTLSTRDKVEYLEVVKNGRVEHEVRLDDWAKAGGKLPKIRFDSTGWFLVRAVTNVKNTYRFATTGPYYVEVGYKPRISRASASFFLEWVRERMAQIKLDNANQQKEVLAYHQQAEKFWRERVSNATEN